MYQCVLCYICTIPQGKLKHHYTHHFFLSKEYVFSWQFLSVKKINNSILHFIIWWKSSGRREIGVFWEFIWELELFWTMDWGGGSRVCREWNGVRVCWLCFSALRRHRWLQNAGGGVAQEPPQTLGLYTPCVTFIMWRSLVFTKAVRQLTRDFLDLKWFLDGTMIVWITGGPWTCFRRGTAIFPWYHFAKGTTAKPQGTTAIAVGACALVHVFFVFFCYKLFYPVVLIVSGTWNLILVLVTFSLLSTVTTPLGLVLPPNGWVKSQPLGCSSFKNTVNCHVPIWYETGLLIKGLFTPSKLD